MNKYNTKLDKIISDEEKALKENTVAESSVFDDEPAANWDEPVSNQKEDYETDEEAQLRVDKQYDEKGIRRINKSGHSQDRQKTIAKENAIKYSNLKQRIAAVSPTVMNQKDGETIANAYDKMLHDPNNPGVKESYSAFIKETEDQFNELKKNGLRIDPIKPGTNPYQTADDLHNDLKKNNHIYYYPSEEGFGSTDNKFGDHPLLKESNVTYKGKKLLNNDVFRIVHDINGHNLANSDFSPEGEHNAFLSHRKMYSPLAGKALFTETAAQANWGSYNKKSGASNRKLMEQGRVNELIFADQKAGLLPDDIINTEWHTGTSRTGKQKTASSYSMPGWYTYGPDMDAIKAFQKKQEYQSGKGVVNRKTGLKRSDWKFRTDGKSLFLHDHEIAKHVKGGIQVSNAGYDTPLTYATLNALGINAKGTKYDPEGGLAELGSKKIDHRSKEWVFVPQDEIQSGPIVYSDRRGKGKQTGRTNEEQSIFRKKAVNKELNEQGRRGLPLSKTNIQPEDQKVIDKATGIESTKPYETLATEAHHVLSYKDNPGLRSNEGNSIMLPADYHKFISNYEKSSPTKNLNRLKQMHSKLDRLIKGKQRKAGMSKKVAQIVNSFKQSGFDPTGTSGIWDAQNSKNLNAYEKPDLERIWELYGRRGMGFNSITNTIEGPNNDIGLIAKQLTEIEEEGGIPALGFDNGSLEAVNVTYGTKDEVLDKLLPHQNSTGYIDEDGKLDIPDNPRYKDYLKEIEKK